MPTVYDRVRTIVVDKLDVDENDVSETASFAEDLNADSLDLVELIMALEEEFSTPDRPVEISDEDAGGMHTLNDAVVYLRNLGIEDQE